MRAEQTKYTAIVGTDVTLVCNGEGVVNDGHTSLSWVFKETEIKNTTDHYRVTVDFYEQDSTPRVITQLSVLNVRYADSGKYDCRIVKLYGRTVKRDTIGLEVKAEGRKPFILISAHAPSKYVKKKGTLMACCRI